MNIDMSDKKEKSNETKQTIILCVSVVILCIIFFSLGYGYSYKHNAEQVRAEMNDWIQESNLCLMPCLTTRGVGTTHILNNSMWNNSGIRWKDE